MQHSIYTSLGVGLFIIAGAWLSVRKRKLTPVAGLTGVAVGGLIFLGCGLLGFLLLALFFLLGTLATSWRRGEKNDVDREGEGAMRRKPGQVLANGGAGALLSLVAILRPEWSDLMLYLTAATFASATADTLSSELGVLYGKRFYNCLTGRSEARGLDGVVSREGTLIGIGGALLIAAAYMLGIAVTGDGVGRSGVEWVERLLILVLAGALGNYVDSVLGATLERRGTLGNDAVNFLSTMSAAVVAWLLLAMMS